MSAKNWATAVLPVVAAAGIGGWGSRNSPTIYARLRKPSWAPPAAAFGPVWTTLYVLTAVAGKRIAERGDGTASALHAAQLALNAAWPSAFFAVRNKRASLAVIAALDATLVAEIVRVRDDRTTAALLLPYLAWSGFATALNAAVSEPAAD